MIPTVFIVTGAFLFLFFVLGLVVRNCNKSGPSGDAGYIPGITDGSGSDHPHSGDHGHHSDGGGNGGSADGGHAGGFDGGSSHSAH